MFTTGMVFIDPDDPVQVQRHKDNVWLAFGDISKSDLRINLDGPLASRIIAALAAALDDHADVLVVDETDR